MRVIVSCDTQNGQWPFCVSLVSELVDTLATQVLLVVCGLHPTQAQLAQLELGVRKNGGSLDIEYLELPHESTDVSESVFVEGRHAVLQLALQWHAHVFHAHAHHFGMLANSGLPVLVVSHEDLCSRLAALGEEPARSVSVAYRVRVREGLRSASMVAAPSPVTVDALSTWYGYGDVVRVIPDGTINAAIDPQPDRDVDLAAVGNDGEQLDNLRCYVNAAMEFRSRIVAVTTDSVLAYARQGTLFGGESGAEDFPLADTRQVRARAKIVVFPTLYQPYCRQELDAAMSGCCLLLSDIPTHRAIWEDTAMYFDRYSPTALCRMAERLLGDPELLGEMASRARSRVQNLFSLDRMAQSYLTTYERLALRYGLSL